MADQFQPPMSGAPQAFTPLDACEIAVGLINAHLAMLSGNAVLRVQIENRETAYQRFDAKSEQDARNEILRWCRTCQQINPAQYTALGLDQYVKTHIGFGSMSLPSRANPYR